VAAKNVNDSCRAEFTYIVSCCQCNDYISLIIGRAMQEIRICGVAAPQELGAATFAEWGISIILVESLA
jgi:hypothetical protein